jgi:glycosyltransferase involved in cell wall biosynthesis
MRGPARWALKRHLAGTASGDTIWIDGASLPGDSRCEFEHALLRRGCRYVFNLLDDWFSVPELRAAALERLRIAHLVIVPTDALKARVLDQASGRMVEVFEEPVDTERLYPSRTRPEGNVVVWAGNPHNFREIQELDDVLRDCHKEVPLLLRVVGGTRRPNLRLSVPWEYRPYSLERERAGFEGASAAIAPLRASAYATCKGAYKIKTYFAMGIPVLASDVGYQSVLVRHGETGFLANTNDDWRAGLLTLLANRERAERMGRAARDEAVARFSHSVVIPTWAAKLTHAFSGDVVRGANARQCG